jgi:hypothetical protein
VRDVAKRPTRRMMRAVKTRTPRTAAKGIYVRKTGTRPMRMTNADKQKRVTATELVNAILRGASSGSSPIGTAYLVISNLSLLGYTLPIKLDIEHPVVIMAR